MTWKPGQSGNPAGGPGPQNKPYRDALRMAIAAAGDNFKVLREVAEAHLERAKTGDVQAIKELEDEDARR